jgi:hypothetical protein
VSTLRIGPHGQGELRTSVHVEDIYIYLPDPQDAERCAETLRQRILEALQSSPLLGNWHGLITSFSVRIGKEEPQVEGESFTFGAALDYLKAGRRVTRRGWNGRNMYLRTALPTELERLGCDWLPFIVMKTVDGRLVPWLASQTDILAEDWELAPDQMAVK